MQPAKPLFTMVVMGLLTTILTLASVLGNGFVLGVLARFKSLRTVPNILTANLALVDLLNAAINMPAFMIYITFEASWLRGKTLAIVNSILNRLFTIPNLTSMLAMMANMYLAISFDLKYFGWKTNKKALVCVFLIWSISIVTVGMSSIPLFDIDLGDARVVQYREEIFKQGKYFVASIMAFFLVLGTIVCFLTTRAIKKNKKKRAELNLPPIQAGARLKNDIKAIKTIAMTIAVYFLCNVPSIVYAVISPPRQNPEDTWFGFITWYCLYLSSAVNPIIYYLRSTRCRSAFKQFLKDPIGSRDFNEKPNGHRNGEKPHDEAMARKRNGERVEREEAGEVERDQNQTSQNYSGERRNGIVILSVQSLEADSYFPYEGGDGRGYEESKAVEGGEAHASNLQIENSSKKKTQEGEIEEGNDEGCKKWDLRKESRKREPSSIKKKSCP